MNPRIQLPFDNPDKSHIQQPQPREDNPRPVWIQIRALMILTEPSGHAHVFARPIFRATPVTGLQRYYRSPRFVTCVAFPPHSSMRQRFRMMIQAVSLKDNVHIFGKMHLSTYLNDGKPQSVTFEKAREDHFTGVYPEDAEKIYSFWTSDGGILKVVLRVHSVYPTETHTRGS